MCAALLALLDARSNADCWSWPCPPDLPSSFDDISAFRQVPDHQEVKQGARGKSLGARGRDTRTRKEMKCTREAEG